MRSFLAAPVLTCVVATVYCQENSQVSTVLKLSDQTEALAPQGAVSPPSVEPADALKWYTPDGYSETAVASDCFHNNNVQPVGKVRARRGEICPPKYPPKDSSPKPGNSENGGTEPFTSPAPFRIPVYEFLFNGRNPLCVTHTQGQLPLAICDSGNANDRWDSEYNIWGLLRDSLLDIATYRLEHCSLGMFSSR